MNRHDSKVIIVIIEINKERNRWRKTIEEE